jgi:hypothetical protein
MEAFLRRLLAGLSVLGALVLVLVLAGVIPPAEPEAARVEPFSVEKAVVPSSKVLQHERDAGAASAARALRFLPLCEAPAAGARWYRLSLTAQQSGLLVFCKQGYELFVGSERAGELKLTRAARFRARGDLPGGAAAGDFDGDGQRDLALGVAARPGVVHRSGAGVYWLRGRAQGGFEPARILAEISSAAIASYAHPGQADQLFVLTAGDVAAQRPAELWAFAREPSLVRKQLMPIGLDPRGLLLRAGAQAGQIEAFALSAQPGRLTRVRVDSSSLKALAEPAPLSVPGVQAFAHEPSHGEALFLRDATSIKRVERGAAIQLLTFAREAHVGPFAVSDLDGDLKADVFAAVAAGVAFLREGERPVEELALPEELRVLDVETLDGGESRRIPVALISGRPDANTLSLLVLPVPPWNRAAVVLQAAELEGEQGVAEVALE